MAFTRRTFIAGAAAIPFAVWLEQQSLAQAPPVPLVRYDATSAKGQAMLKTYAQAVAKMKATAEGDPRGWVFQWYTHWVKGPMSLAPKAAEIARIYPSASPWKSLAQDMWDTCQAHWGGDENFFLPWHRMFVYFFESIVRKVSATPSFALPYWNYSTANPALRGVVPVQFRQPNDPIFKSLYVSKRNALANQGKNIAQGQPGNPLSLAPLGKCKYESTPSVQGFCLNLDANLHGNIHVLTGNSQNMGAVPWAAGDPIFWMHHSNIDRLWASWNAAGRKNPSTATFLAKTFIFADANGTKVIAKVQDFLDIAKLKYSYDKLEPVPACPTVAITEAAPTRRARVKTPLALGAAPVRVNLEPEPGVESGEPRPGRHLYLVLKGLSADDYPGVLYHVYLELPAGTDPGKRQDLYVGELNFFDAVGHAHAATEGAGAPKFFSFDITELAKKLRAKGALTAKPAVTIVPAGQPPSTAKPVVGEISLVEE